MKLDRFTVAAFGGFFLSMFLETFVFHGVHQSVIQVFVHGLMCIICADWVFLNLKRRYEYGRF